jgi:hypothetical protein
VRLSCRGGGQVAVTLEAYKELLDVLHLKPK